ncbi:MAG TPA: HAD family hydrolase [Candidatus Omnitrophota bacterium]|nr:HAD family hydrolase [Candidatus Omnitrophota bacterium]
MTRAVFLDRDGVINRYPGDGKYVTNLKEFSFLPKVKEAIALLTSHKYPLFIISNQAGVGKGLYSQAVLERITEHMLKELSRHKGKVQAVYYCTHRNEDNCSCRKPKAGLIKKAIDGRDIDIKNSFFVGDTIRDIQTARAAGCRSILIFSGQEKPANRDSWPVQPDYVFPDLYQAAKFIIQKNKGSMVNGL